ncbi:Protein SMG7 [Sphaceloma murrayae]|uniref:Protein SMG7 n=1 Tax=Sphaceloma murrayae TaxID=2082308 RepID=A0A2K1QJB0_9PEZI|nr:Protein SMG7 [Sphaceloma murrayae]
MQEYTQQLVRDISEVDAGIKQAARSARNKDQHPSFFQNQLRKYRARVEELCRRDILLDRQSGAHQSLWSAHNLVNGFCRKGLAKLRSDPAKPVETRKFIKSYLEFLKDSQKWYRLLITSLTKTYGWQPGLEQITGKPSSTSPHPNSDCRQASANVCYQALISLGDLCRWRAAEKLDREPTWSHAVGYYDLAAALTPSNGAAFHQRAFIEISQKDHFRAIYYFYRSIVVEDRFPNAINNLAIELKSLRKKWGSEELDPTTASTDTSVKRKALTMWFIRLHSLSYTGEEIPGHAELESTFLMHLEDATKRQDNSGLLLKLVMANMAAERTSLIRLSEADGGASGAIITAFNNFHRLTVRTLTALLRALEKQLSLPSPQHANGRAHSHPLARLVSPEIQTILPALRIYQYYLLSNRQFLLADEPDSLNGQAAQEFWTTFARVSSRIANTFPLAQLPEVRYPLAEDVDAIAFGPVVSKATAEMWTNVDGSPSSRPGDQGVNRESASVEMLSRLRDFQVVCVRLSVLEDTPMHFERGRFFIGNSRGVAAESSPEAQLSAIDGNAALGHQSESTSRNPRHRPNGQAHPPAVLQQEAIMPARPTKSAVSNRTPPLQSPAQISAGHVTPPRLQFGEDHSIECQEEQAMRMVDDLVGPDDSPRTLNRPVSGLGHHRQRTPSAPSSFAPTPPTSRVGSRMERLQSGALYGQGGQTFASGMHSPLLFGNGGTWSPAPALKARGVTPPNAQAG